MKKLVIFFGVLIAGSPFVSCKKMKDDIKDLKNEVNTLQKQNDTLKQKNDTLKTQLNGVISSLGSDEPITVTTTFTDNIGATRTISGIYKFKTADYASQSMINNGDGTYKIKIQRYNDIGGYEAAWVSFTYNPSTKAVTSISGEHYWYNADSYDDDAYYPSGTYTGLTKSVTVDSFDPSTGAISIKFAASATAAFTSSYYGPNPGAPVATTFSFTGKLGLVSKN